MCVAEIGDGLERWDRGADLTAGGQRQERTSDYISFKCFSVFEAHNYTIDHT